MLSALYAGNELAAVHFGMRSSTVWHYWFPTYNPAFKKYSCGQILLMKMAEIAPSMGMTAIDLGKGGNPYKHRFMNGSVALLEGLVEIPSVACATRNFAARCAFHAQSSRVIALPVRWGKRTWRSLVDQNS